MPRINYHFGDCTIVRKSIGYKDKVKVVNCGDSQNKVWNPRVECGKNPQKGGTYDGEALLFRLDGAPIEVRVIALETLKD